MSKGSQSYTPLKDTSQEGCPPPKPDRRTSGNFFQHFIRPLFAELIGVVFFVFVGVTCLYPTQTGSSRTAIALTHGFILFVLVAVTAEASGGHLNPAVTLALTICRGLQPILAPFYVLAQLSGGIIGAALAKTVLTHAHYDIINGGVHQLGDDIDPGQGILAEAVATSILVLVVLMVAFDDKNKSVLAPLAIGLTVAGCIFSIGDISGASMNPARSFGPAVVRNYWEYHYVYWVGPILGSIFSSLMYGLVLASPNRLWLPFYEPVE